MIIVIYAFIRWAGMARVIRGMALSLREQQLSSPRARSARLT